MLTFRILDFDRVPWDELDRMADRVVFQTRAWMRFIAEAQRATPVVVELRAGSRLAGYFSGLTFRRFGVKILGSSFPGWTTPHIGFNLLPGMFRAEALPAVERLAFGDLGCLHLEVSDPGFDGAEGAAGGFTRTSYDSYETDLTLPEETLFANMDSACRRCIRKAEKTGIVIEETHDAAFASEYYEQLKDVFAKQGLVPSYTLERVRTLIKHLAPSGYLLLLRARTPDGRCIATGIYPGMNRSAHFWGNASWRAYQNLRPNEALHWYAIRYWKNRGMERFDWGGGGTYKEKYGVRPISVPWYYKSRFKVLSDLRNQASRLFNLGQHLAGGVKQRIRAVEKPGAPRQGQ